jgi:hypothetical protein
MVSNIFEENKQNEVRVKNISTNHYQLFEQLESITVRSIDKNKPESASYIISLLSQFIPLNFR